MSIAWLEVSIISSSLVRFVAPARGSASHCRLVGSAGYGYRSATCISALSAPPRGSHPGIIRYLGLSQEDSVKGASKLFIAPTNIIALKEHTRLFHPRRPMRWLVSTYCGEDAVTKKPKYRPSVSQKRGGLFKLSIFVLSLSSGTYKRKDAVIGVKNVTDERDLPYEAKWLGIAVSSRHNLPRADGRRSQNWSRLNVAYSGGKASACFVKATNYNYYCDAFSSVFLK